MNIDGEHSTLSILRDLVLVLACILALVLPFVLTRQMEGSAGTVSSSVCSMTS